MDDSRFDALAKTVAAGAQSRRAALRVAGGAVAALVAGAGSEMVSAQTCRGNGAPCDLFSDCCSRRCQGALCERDAECRSGICGPIDAASSICRDAGCRRASRVCADSTECCRGVCNSSTFRCVD